MANAKARYDTHNINLMRALVFGVLGSLNLALMGLCVKLVSGSVSTNITIFARFLISFMYIASILGFHLLRGHYFPLKPQFFSLYILRAIAGMLAMLLFYYSLNFIPLMDGNLLTMTNPLYIPILAFIFLGIRTQWSVIIAILIGFCGTAFVLKPSTGLIDPHALYAAGAGIAGAFAIFIVRELGKRDHPKTMMFYYFLITMLLSAVSMLFHFHIHWSWHTVLMLLGVGIFGTIYQECLIRGSCYAPASIISTLLYLSVVFSTLFDWLIWGLIPDIWNILGLVLIIAASYTIVTRN